MIRPNTTAATIETWLIREVTELTDSEDNEVHPESRLSNLGFDSILVEALSAAIEDQFLIDVESAQVARANSITELRTIIVTLLTNITNEAHR